MKFNVRLFNEYALSHRIHNLRDVPGINFVMAILFSEYNLFIIIKNF